LGLITKIYSSAVFYANASIDSLPIDFQLKSRDNAVPVIYIETLALCGEFSPASKKFNSFGGVSTFLKRSPTNLSAEGGAAGRG
jgi:hypothetical protein